VAYRFLLTITAPRPSSKRVAGSGTFGLCKGFRIQSARVSPSLWLTGLAIVRGSDGTELTESEATAIYPKRLIAEHIKSGAWRDKAGAYAIKENRDEFIERIKGSLMNVMGLSIELLRRMLTPVS